MSSLISTPSCFAASRMALIVGFSGSRGLPSEATSLKAIPRCHSLQRQTCRRADEAPEDLGPRLQRHGSLDRDRRNQFPLSPTSVESAVVPSDVVPSTVVASVPDRAGGATASLGGSARFAVPGAGSVKGGMIQTPSSPRSRATYSPHRLVRSFSGVVPRPMPMIRSLHAWASPWVTAVGRRDHRLVGVTQERLDRVADANTALRRESCRSFAT